MIERLRHYFHAPVAAARPYLLLKGVLLLLAFDAWIEMTEHGGRYGVGDFNVAHFTVLDAVGPGVTADLYVGTLLLVGLLSLSMVLARPHRVGMACLCALYTYAWSMSMLDSYQHHYLLTLLLFSLAFAPLQTSSEVFGRLSTSAADPEELRREARRRKRRRRSVEPTGGAAGVPRVSAWGYVSVAVTCAIVYGYTSITKMEGDWREGHALRRLAGDNPGALSIRDALGADPETFWSDLAHSAILIQIVIAVGYLIAARQDDLRRPAWRVIVALWVAAPLSFHVGAEHMDLKIGWFSYYMMYVALVFFLPAQWLHAAGWVATWPVRRLTELWAGWTKTEDGDGDDERLSILVLAVAAGGVLALLGHLVDLPGSLVAGAVGGIALVLGVGWLSSKGRVIQARPWILAAGAAGLAMWLSIASSSVRYDYYRFVGGDMRRRGELERSLEAYEKANRYAPSECEALHDERLPEARRRCDRRREEAQVRAQLRGGGS